MKDSKFIELLNLYIDHQISPTDAALLEAEIQQKPERRKIYREYCQMQKACGILAENFRSEAASGKITERSPAPRRMALVTYAMGFAAAAACVALVVVKRPVTGNSDIAATTSSIAQTVTTEEVEMAAVTSTSEPSRTVLHPAFPGVARDDAPAAVAVADHVPLDWMHQVQFQSVTADHLRFDANPERQTQDLTLRSTRPYHGQVETTAFIFAK